ncbi:LysM peptidoglycan-binding domain-containing protein [Stieleria sp. JC731]|uniref:papain-like cysteine protease family protein n=1 Tax=Pirellulaceae TaxID=2691357 RepID=UPI001E4F3321|nr:papain-like cysteine protease family protein [Stieleria sp. JC731]MCC9604140.1 LysM peptidoglycan-binding domain-containing protein [Stieleria sp. JC731]
MAKYVIPDMKLIPQQMGWSCWYASARMLIQWQMNRCQQSFVDMIPPELDRRCQQIRDADQGITNPAILQMARRLGLRQEPQISPSSNTSAEIETMLRIHGPLWVNGDAHIVVIAGIDGDRVKVYDPWPPRRGAIEWRSLSGWLLRETSGMYTVQKGDTLSLIGRDHGVDWKKIYQHANNAAFRTKRPDPNRISVGDQIFIPTSSSDMDTSGSISFLYLPARTCSL